MDAELKAKWVAALRSGKYAQGRHELRAADNTYCCLGVLCDVAAIGWKQIGHFGTWAPATEFEGPAYPDVEVRTRTGLDGEEGKLWRLVDMNDRGMPFAEIADYIEANL